jgi:hypothetical protein
LGSIGKSAINLGEPFEKTKFTPPSPNQSIPTLIARYQDDVCLLPFDTGDVMMTSSSQHEGIHVNYSTPTNKDPPEGKTTAVIAVMRGRTKDGCHRRRSSKHYTQKLVWVLLDSSSDGNLVFVSKDKPILLPYSKRLVPQL